MICEAKVWSDIWHPHTCGKPAKFITDDLDRVALCGIHRRTWEREGHKVVPIDRAVPSAAGSQGK